MLVCQSVAIQSSYSGQMLSISIPSHSPNFLGKSTTPKLKCLHPIWTPFSTVQIGYLSLSIYIYITYITISVVGMISQKTYRVHRWHVFQNNELTINRWHLFQINERNNDTVDGRYPAPVEVGSLAHYLQGFIHPKMVGLGISEPSTGSYVYFFFSNSYSKAFRGSDP